MDQKITGIKNQIKRARLDGVLISSPYNISFLTGYSNFSVEEREAFVLITKEKQFIFTDGRYTEAIKREVANFELIEISSANSFKDQIKDLAKKLKLQKIGIEEDDLTYKEYKGLRKVVKKLENFEVRKSRAVKTDEEIKYIEEACKLGDKAFEYLMGKIKVGVSEKELAFEYEMFVKKSGAGLSFETIVAFGNNSSIPHHHTGEKILEKKDGSFVLLDFGTKVKSYCSDMTRTLFFGKASEKQKSIYKTVFEAHEKAAEFLNKNFKKEIRAKEVDKIARDYIISKGFPTIPHSLGHGIGLQVHEHPYLSPKSEEVLKEGMVFSIEPGIYIEGFGGVRIEDLFVIEKNGLRQLTNSSKELMEL